MTVKLLFFFQLKFEVSKLIWSVDHTFRTSRFMFFLWVTPPLILDPWRPVKNKSKISKQMIWVSPGRLTVVPGEVESLRWGETSPASVLSQGWLLSCHGRSVRTVLSRSGDLCWTRQLTRLLSLLPLQTAARAPASAPTWSLSPRSSSSSSPSPSPSSWWWRWSRSTRGPSSSGWAGCYLAGPGARGSSSSSPVLTSTRRLTWEHRHLMYLHRRLAHIKREF